MDVGSATPATGEELGAFRSATALEMAKALTLARAAQQAWGPTPGEQRERLFRRLAGLIKERSQSIFDLLKAEAGKPRPDAEAELFDVLDAVDYYLDQYQKIVPDLSVGLN